MGKVLVIENDTFMLEVIRAVLELAGRRVTTATSGDEGLRRFRLEKSDIDLVILDLRLSTAIEGADTLRALRSIDPALKVIIASAYSQHEVEEFLSDQRWDAVLRKPYDMDQLLQAVDSLQIGRAEAATRWHANASGSDQNAGWFLGSSNGN
jgi:CheY-like chemotaxis protein